MALRDERAAIDAFCKRVGELDPDVLTGWNVVDFDLSVLARIAQRVRHPFELGRDAGGLRVRRHAAISAAVARAFPDGWCSTVSIYCAARSCATTTIRWMRCARQVLGEGKALEGDARDRVGEIMQRYRNDLPGFALYARTDARLALEIAQKLDLIELSVARSKLTGMTPDRVAASIASFDFLYLARTQQAPHRRTERAQRRCARVCGASGRPRA